MCAKCQTVWVKKGQSEGKFTTYRFSKQELCTGCQDMAVEMINTGKTEGVCPKCGETLRACTM